MGTLVLEGELDLASADRVVEAVDLCAVPEGDTIFEVAALTFIDAAGAHAMVAVAEELPIGSKLVIRGATGPVREVLRMLRIDRHPRVVVEPSIPA